MVWLMTIYLCAIISGNCLVVSAKGKFDDETACRGKALEAVAGLVDEYGPVRYEITCELIEREAEL